MFQTETENLKKIESFILETELIKKLAEKITTDNDQIYKLIISILTQLAIKDMLDINALIETNILETIINKMQISMFDEEQISSDLIFIESLAIFLVDEKVYDYFKKDISIIEAIHSAQKNY